MENMVTTAQAAKALGVTVRYINRQCKNGEIPNAVKDSSVGRLGKWFIPKEYVESHRKVGESLGEPIGESVGEVKRPPSSPIPDSDAVKDLKDRLAQTQTEAELVKASIALSELKAERDRPDVLAAKDKALTDREAAIIARENAYNGALSTLAERQEAVAARESDVKAREQAVEVSQREAKALVEKLEQAKKLMHEVCDSWQHEREKFIFLKGDIERVKSSGDKWLAYFNSGAHMLDDGNRKTFALFMQHLESCYLALTAEEWKQFNSERYDKYISEHMDWSSGEKSITS